MNLQQENMKWDEFLVQLLKTENCKHSVPQWSELEILLTKKRKAVSALSTTILLKVAVAVIIVAAIFFLIKFISSPSSSENDTNREADVLTFDAGNDTLPSTITEQKKDTLSVSDSLSHTHFPTYNDTLERQHAISVEQHTKNTDAVIRTQGETDQSEKKDKASKISSLAPEIIDTGKITDIILPLLPDTAEKKISQDHKTITVPVHTPSSQTPAKSKKTKKQKTISADSASKNISSLPSLPDTLK